MPGWEISNKLTGEVIAAYPTYNDDTLPLGVHDWGWVRDSGCNDGSYKGNRICITHSSLK